MTRNEAERCLEDGCRHNPFNDDICGKCAKDILAVMRGDEPDVDRAELARWFQFEDEEEKS